MSSTLQPELAIDAGPKPCRSPVRWVGGKHYSAKRIIAAMPPHKHYVEVFGGGAHVLCQKPPSPIETYNDINQDVVNFFRVCRKQPEDLIRYLHWTPYARVVRDELTAVYANGGFDRTDPVRWAAEWFTLLRQIVGGALEDTSGWSYALTASYRGMAGAVSVWLSAIDSLEGLAARFRRVQLECLDFRNLVPKYDTPETLFYCDPPYIGTEGYYVADFGEADHRDLARLLHTIEGKAMLSYYPHPLVDELYRGWRCMSWEAVKWRGKVGGGKRQRATELLLMNYDEKGERIPDGCDA